MIMDKLTNKQLKEELALRNLPTSGTKCDLQLRLRDAMINEGLDPEHHEFDNGGLGTTEMEEVDAGGRSVLTEKTVDPMEGYNKAYSNLMAAMERVMEQLQNRKEIMDRKQTIVDGKNKKDGQFVKSPTNNQSKVEKLPEIKTKILEVKTDVKVEDQQVLDVKVNGTTTQVVAPSKMAPEYMEIIKNDACLDSLQDVEIRRSVVLSQKPAFVETVDYDLTNETGCNVMCGIEMNEPAIMGDGSQLSEGYSDVDQEIRCWGYNRTGRILGDGLKWRRGRPLPMYRGLRSKVGRLVEEQDQRDCVEQRGERSKAPEYRSTWNKRRRGRPICWIRDKVSLSRDCKWKKGTSPSRRLWRRNNEVVATNDDPITIAFLNKVERDEENGNGDVDTLPSKFQGDGCRIDFKQCGQVERKETNIDVIRMELLPSEEWTPEDIKTKQMIPRAPVCDLEYMDNRKGEFNEGHRIVRWKMRLSRVRMMARCDARPNIRGFEEGKLIWLHNPQRRKGLSPKLQSAWEGPYTIITKMNDVIYRIRKGRRGKPKVVHLERMALYRGEILDPVRDEQV